jgi:hypothetical protein
MALTDRQESLLEGVFKQYGDSEVRRALLQLVSDNQALVSGAGTPAAAGVAADEHGDSLWHVTKLTLTSFAVGISGDNASLGIGAKVYTFPAGDILIEGASISGGLTADVDNTAQTPECGLGTTVGTGAIATLSTTMEDIVDGGAAGIIGGDNTAPDVAGGTFRKGTVAASSEGVLIKSSGGKSHDVYLNVAVAWANVAAAGAVTFDGVITLKWRKIN